MLTQSGLSVAGLSVLLIASPNAQIYFNLMGAEKQSGVYKY